MYSAERAALRFNFFLKLKKNRAVFKPCSILEAFTAKHPSPAVNPVTQLGSDILTFLTKGLFAGLILGNISNNLPDKPLPIDVFKEERYFLLRSAIFIS